MVGCCGAIGGACASVAEVASSLTCTGDERVSRYEDDSLRIRGVRHPSRSGKSPGRAPERNALVWVWGNVVGYRRSDGSDARRPVDEPVPAFCARRYDEDGLEFASRLNGDFVGIVYDRERGTVSVVTDRLGSWRLYYTRGDDGALVFSTHLQSLDRYPGVSLAFDEEYVAQHVSYQGGPYGVKTPFEDVEMFRPGSVTTCDLADGSLTSERYWRPSLATDSEFDGFDAVVDRFVERFRASVAARTRDRSKEYGVLVSGGSDARLVLGALPDDLDVTAYHMSDWMSKEARIAERIAMTAGAEFRLLRRDLEYFGRVLDRSPAIWNYEQLFNQAWATGFIEEIRSEVDVLFTGHFLDTMFKGCFVPTKSVSLGRFGPWDVPREWSIETLDEYFEELGPNKPGYVDSDVDLAAVFDRNVTLTDDGVESYGVEFDSLRDFVLGRLHVPATTDSFFRQSLREHVELQTPVYDNRLMDLWAAIPTRYTLRRNVVNAAVEAVDPELAAIPHADSGVSVSASRPLHQFGTLPMNALRRLSPFDAVPAGHVNHNPWGNHADLIRTQSYVEDALDDAEPVVRSLPFLNWDEIQTCYQTHLDGTNTTKYLYRLVTFLEAPLTRRIADATESDKYAVDEDAVEGSTIG